MDSTEPNPIIERIDELAGFAIGLIGLVILVNFITGAIMYISAAGSPEKIAHAKTRMMRGVAGLVMLALLGVVARWALLGVDPS